MKKRLMLLAALFGMCLPNVSAANATYGQSDNIPESNILHCFSWPLKDITSELPNIAAAGFGAIQISPLQRPDINEGWTWYTIYLPYGYHLYNSPGMGSKDDLKKLCSEAEKYGIKIVVDVVFNHVNKTEPYYNPWFAGEGRWRQWGSNGKEIDYRNRYSITHESLGDYVELNTENGDVIAKANAYIQELRECGVKGLRFDAAKHIELPSDCNHDSKFWPTISGNKDMWLYGEIVGQVVDGNDDQISEYADFGIWVPEPGYTSYAARENGGIPTSHGGDRDNKTNGHLVYYGESHDDYSNDEWSERLDQGIIDRAYCAYACRNTQTALYYSRPRARGKDNIKIEKGSTAYMGKHIVEVNKFRNAMVGRADYFTHENGVVSITRKDGGAVIIAKGSNCNVNIANGDNNCPNGTYTDRVSGNQFTVRDGRITGKVGPTGVAVIYNDYKTTPTPATVTITGNKVYNVAYAGNFSNGKNYIHYWKGDEYTTTWPGVPMERAYGSDGKYYWCYNVPADAEGIIFNNGSDNMQTGNLPLVTNYIMDNGGATIIPVKFQKGTVPTEPKTDKTVRIAGNYNLAYSGDFENIHYWQEGSKTNGTEWPGVPMERSYGSDGKYYRCYNIPAGVTHVIFTNGEEQTGNLPYSSTKIMCESGATEIPVQFNADVVEPEPDPEPDAVIIYGDYNLAYSGDKNKIHYWGGTPSSEWPGESFTETAVGSDGKIYKVYKVGAGTTNVLFHSNEDEDKTADLTYSGAYIMNDFGRTTTKVEFRPKSEEPVLDPITITGNYNVAYTGEYTHVYYWDNNGNNNGWPGQKMSSAKGDDGKSYKVFSVPAATTHVIFTNGAENNTKKTSDLIFKSSYVMTDNGASNQPVIFKTTEDPTPTPGEDAPEPEALSVVWPTSKYCFFVNSKNWNIVKYHAWNSKGDITSWPGNQITAQGAEKYFYDATSNVPTGLIFNNGSSGTNNQTGDLTFKNGATYHADSKMYGGESETFPNQLYVLGNLKDHSWDFTYNGVRLDKIDNKGIYLAYGVDLANSGDGFCYFDFMDAVGPTGGEWDDFNKVANRYGAFTSNKPLSLNSPTHVIKYVKNQDASSSKSWKVAYGTYDIIVNLYDMTVTLLSPQTQVPTVEAQQLAEVQKSSASEGIKTYDYITYPPTNGKAYGVQVNGDQISVTQVSVNDDTYLNSENVFFTEKVLVTTSFTGTAAYNLDPRTASFGKKQNDGKFRGILALDNLDENTISSKVNYYYTLREGVDVKVPMQSPAGSTTVKLAMPEPKLINAGVTLVNSGDTKATFNYEGIEFEARYNELKEVIEVEAPNATAELTAIAGEDLFTVSAPEGMTLSEDGYSYIGETVSPLNAFYNFSAPDAALETGYISDIARWEGSEGNVTDNISMTYTPPVINSCIVKSYTLGYNKAVLEDGKEEDHLFETIGVELNVTTEPNAIISKNSDNEELKNDEISHAEEGDFYLVEFYKDSEMVASAIVEGTNGAQSFTLTKDNGLWWDGQEEYVLSHRFYQNLKVHVSTLYPFLSERSYGAGAPQRAPGRKVSQEMIETTAAEDEVDIDEDEISTSIENILQGFDATNAVYYNTQGIRVGRPEMPGVYVVREANGTTRKIVVK